MYQDGVCRVTPRTFSKCIEFTDISYQLAQADTKTAIFENLCDLYNYLDASMRRQEVSFALGLFLPIHGFFWI